MQLKQVKISDRLIGEGQPVYLIAEIGGNFRTLEQGREIIERAIDSGVDAVKLQTLRADTLVTRGSRFSTIAGGANQYEIFKQIEISEKWHRELFDFARSRGITIFSTPSYFDDVDLLERLKAPAYKIGSDDLTNIPFLQFVASKQKPVILSTGMAVLEEVREAVQAVLSAGNSQVVVLHCVSSYPVKNFSDLNLRCIQTLKEVLKIPVGFSDHSYGTLAACLAVSLGASVIEKHFTLDKKMDTPDSFFSADPAEMKELVEKVRQTEKALGAFEKRPTKEEERNKLEVRKSIVTRKKIKRGEMLQKESVTIKRPGTGIEPKRLTDVIGKKAIRDLEADEVISWDEIG